MQALDVKNLSKSFDGRKIIDNVSFSISQGEIFGIVGLNGVGKTTMIKSILSLINHDFGTVDILGKSSADSLSRANVCYMPEKFTPNENITGMEYISFYTRIYGHSMNVDEVLSMTHIVDLNPDYLKLKIRQCSKGTIQKIGLLACFAANAKLLILDEPTSGLDVKARHAFKEYLKLYKSRGKSVLFSSHILSDVEELCDRAGIFANTKFGFIGVPSEFKKQYTSDTLEGAFVKFLNIKN